MKILLPDGTELTEELLNEWSEEESKKCCSSWLDKKFPNGIADHNPRYALTHPWIIIEDWLDNIKYAWQRAFRGWDDRATWGIDSYLSNLIPQLVKELRKKQGIPMACFEGLPMKEDGNFTEKEDEIAEQRWHEILDKISTGFERYKDLTFYSTLDKKEEEDRKKFEEAFDLFREHFSSLWW